MEMSFREKSAWGFMILFSLAGAFYAWEVVGNGLAIGEVPPPSFKLAAVYIGLVVIGAIISQSSLAASSAEEADLPADERERVAIDRAGNWSGIILAFGAIAGALHFYSFEDGRLMFHIVVGALMLSQIADYAFQIWLFRRGV